MSSPHPQTVLRRQVFYIPGFDPFPPRRYRELYRREAARQAAISGYDITVTGTPQDPTGWEVSAQQDGVRTETHISVLVWSDIVRQSFESSIPGTYASMLRTAWIYIATGALMRLLTLRRGPVVAALYPVVVLLIQAATALAAAALVLRIGAGSMTGDRLILLREGLVWAAALGLAWGILRFFRAQDHRIFAWYLMHDYAYSASERGAYPAALSDRITEFADRIGAARHSGVDEVLVVGHSSGAFLAVSALARLQRRAPAKGGATLGLLTLGQVVPMVSFLPDADDLRRDIGLMGAQSEMAWVDVTAPGDGCSFALCDPVRVSGQGCTETQWPIVISAAFSRTLLPQTWQALRRRYFRLHFQYLCAFDRPGDYDYFRVTAGPLALRDRFAGRAPSPSVITRNASGFGRAGS